MQCRISIHMLMLLAAIAALSLAHTSAADDNAVRSTAEGEPGIAPARSPQPDDVDISGPDGAMDETALVAEVLLRWRKGFGQLQPMQEAS